MINEMVKHYTITEKIGEGGMGVVYKAHDSKLDRTVALKFLPPSLSASEERKSRFLNEARAASALEHQNTCSIHEIGETDGGQLYIVMPAYEGGTLKDLIGEDGLSAEKALDIAIQIGEGLKAAHDKKIIHRDIKSGNILITEHGQSVIMDFGLARREGATQLTKTGETLGTVPYMSPEQARGEEVDHRTDIWSMGVVLYEMLAGRSPFQSEYPHAVIYSILNEEPEDLRSLRPDMPAGLWQVVKTALAKNREERYQQVEDLLNDLKEIERDLKGYSRQPARFDLKRALEFRAFAPVSLTVILLLLAAAAGYFLYSSPEEIHFNGQDWIMITDFDNQTGEEVFDQFLNTVLEISLQQSKYVNIYQRSTVQSTLAELQNEDVRTLTLDAVEAAARQKNVTVVAIPSIRRTGDTYSLSVQLQDLESQSTHPIEPVEAAGKERVLQAIDELAKKVRLKLGESSSNISRQYIPITQATTGSLEALKLYAEGIRLRGSDATSGYELIEQAIEIDPEFALAHAEVGMHYYINGNRQKGEEHFQKALDLMDRLTVRERLWIRAVAEDWRGNREKAIENYTTYLTQYPDDYSGWWRLGYTYLITGKHERCIDAFSRVVEIDSYDASAFVNIATCFKASGEDNQALDNYRRAFEIRPDFKKGEYVNNEFGFLLVRMGNVDEARDTFELMLSEEKTKARGIRSLALLNMYLGKYSAAIEQFKEAILLNKSFGRQLSEFRDRCYLARAYTVKGMDDEFKEELDRIGKLIGELRLSPSWLADAGKIYARTAMTGKASRLLDDISQRIDDPVAVSGVNRSDRGDRAYYHMLKGEIALVRGNHREALESLEIAHNISGHAESLAYGYYVSGNLEKAVEAYREIIDNKSLGHEYQQQWILAHYRLGKIYEERREFDKARQYYERFLEIWGDGDEDIVYLQEVRERLKKLTVSVG